MIKLNNKNKNLLFPYNFFDAFMKIDKTIIFKIKNS